jgi:hypothetical membrane protein
MTSIRRAAGVIGPTAFVGTWLVAGARRKGYSPVHDAISELARVGTSSRPLMTMGFVTFGVTVPLFALASRRELGTPAAAALTVAGLATLAVAGLPLEDGTSDTAHGIAAVTGYVGMAAAPYLATRRRPELAISVVAALALALTTVEAWHGLFQRVGLGVVDVWIVATALRRRR